MKRLFPLQLALLLLPCLSCDEPEKPGSVEVAWRTGQLSCEEAGVSRVAAKLFSFDGAEPAASGGADCEARELTFDPVAVGSYSLRLEGLDEDGCWTHEARLEDVRLQSGEELDLGELALLRRQRPLWIKWPFDNLLDCTANDVEQVQITVDVEDRESITDTFGCMGLNVRIPRVPAGNARVEVVGFDARDTPVAKGAVQVQATDFRAEPCEDVVLVVVELSVCLEAGCE